MRRAMYVLAVLGVVIVGPPARAEDPPELLKSWSVVVGGYDPLGIGVDPAGNVYTTDVGTNAIFKFSGEGAFLGQIGGPGTGGGLFNTPVDVAIDQTGTMYVSDCGNHMIQVLDSNGSFVRQWPAQSCGWLGLDPAGQFICQKATDSILVFRTSDGVRLAGWAFVSSDIPSVDRGFGVGPSGVIYVATSYYDVVTRYASDGTLLGSWGVSGLGPGQLQGPFVLTVDANDRVYVSDQGYRVQKFAADGQFLTGWGTPVGVTDMVVDAAGNVFILDDIGRRVQKWGYGPTPARRQSWGALKRLFRQ